MASPDVTPYIDLVLNDKEPQDIFDAALVILRSKLPEWVPRESNIEVLLLEAMASEVAELIFAVNRVPSSVVEALMKLYGVDRDAGQQPQTDLRFYMSGTSGYTIPEGVTVALELDGGLEPIVFTTQTELVIPEGDSEGVAIDALGDRYTSEANGVAAGTIVDLIDSIVYVDRVELNYVVHSGRDPEEDEDYFDRAVQRFGRLTETLVVPDHFVVSAIEEPYVVRATALDNYDAPSDDFSDGPVGVDPGHITVAVYGNGANLSSDEKTILLAKFEDEKLSTLQVHLIDPVVNAIDIDVTIRVLSGYDEGDVITNVTTALTGYLDPGTWDWSGVLRRNEIISLISQAEGVNYIENLTTPSGNLTLNGIAPLVTTGTITVNIASEES